MVLYLNIFEIGFLQRMESREVLILLTRIYFNDNVTMYNNGNVDEKGWVSNEKNKDAFKTWSEMRIRHGKKLTDDINAIDNNGAPSYVTDQNKIDQFVYRQIDKEVEKQNTYNHYESLSS